MYPFPGHFLIEYAIFTIQESTLWDLNIHRPLPSPAYMQIRMLSREMEHEKF